MSWIGFTHDPNVSLCCEHVYLKNMVYIYVNNRFTAGGSQSTECIYYYYWYSALGPVWAETRAQSDDWYGSGTLHPGQVLRGSLPLLSPAF